MAGPLLETKLHVPRLRHGTVARPRLTERLNRGTESALTLVSAPAGFGKTTLLAAWLAAAAVERRSTAWLSLDQRDNESATFWTYLVAALETVAGGVGTGALSLLQSPQVPIEGVLAALLNELSAISDDVVLVLDDYHVIDARDVQEGMAFLLEHLPPQIHLVIASRADPPLPLARLRARGELVEIRAGDLRFTPDEAATYLNEVMGLALTADDITALEKRTEGWIAALQLAALSMQGRDDVVAFIAGFAGDDRYIVDYLAEEVLLRQTEHVKQFLLQTSILDRMSGPLCEAVTGQGGGKATLAALERGNLFLVPLDDRRRWYRYHHLFADVLRAHLLDEQPDDVPSLHVRASRWYEHNGEPAEAIRHALAAEDFERAADLVERAGPTMQRTRQEATLLGWLRALPDHVFDRRPVLSASYGGVLLSSGEFEGVESRLRAAERWLDALPHRTARTDDPSAEMVVVDEEQFRRLPAQIAVWRAGIAQVLGQGADTVKHARRALDLVGEDDHLVRGAATALMGLASWARGDLHAAYEMYAECIVNLQRAGNISDVIGCSITLADIRITQGRLRAAMAIYERGLQLASEQGGPVLRGAADMYVGMSGIHREHGDLGAALQQLVRSQELGESNGLPQNRYRSCVAMARIREAEGDLDGAVELLDEAERVFANDFSPKVRPVAPMRTRVWVTQSRLGEALGWAHEQGLSAQDDLSYVREFEHVTLARVLLAQHKSDRANRSTLLEATELLERLLQAAEVGGRTGTAIEILVLQALAYQLRGDVRAALVPLERALTRAEPEGYLRIFVDEGPPMAALLEAAGKHGIASTYVRRLLTAFGKADERTPVKQVLIEPLSERELDVLRLLGSDLGGPAIARELVVSLNTVRTHTKNIYAKLGVNNRRAAVRRADELELLQRARNGQTRPAVVHRP
jgi:LuxR family maltose regulon positive regulatory protein